jgi:hypothetical protein
MKIWKYAISIFLLISTYVSLLEKVSLKKLSEAG